jgi:hypothetical protein
MYGGYDLEEHQTGGAHSLKYETSPTLRARFLNLLVYFPGEASSFGSDAVSVTRIADDGQSPGAQRF